MIRKCSECNLQVALFCKGYPDKMASFGHEVEDEEIVKSNLKLAHDLSRHIHREANKLRTECIYLFPNH